VGLRKEQIHWTGNGSIRRAAAAAVAVGLLTSCSAVVSSTTSGMADSLADALVNQNDPETVRAAVPAYLILIDGLIKDSPDNAGVLLAGAELYSSYAAAFVDDPVRANRLAVTGRDYGWRGMCSQKKTMCDTWTARYEDFEAALATLGPKNVDAAFTTASAWATWIRVNRGDWSAIADKARVDAMIRRVVELEPDFRDGAAYLYLGALESLLPAAMGGRPEEGRKYFEKAIEMSDGHNLMAKVLFASEYARMTFDRELHDRLLQEVVAADPVYPDLTLSNVLAQEQAQALLADSEEYFGE
jgi:tetratricopeptide (TPR) repeat protein